MSNIKDISDLQCDYDTQSKRRDGVAYCGMLIPQVGLLSNGHGECKQCHTSHRADIVWQVLLEIGGCFPTSTQHMLN